MNKAKTVCFLLVASILVLSGQALKTYTYKYASNVELTDSSNTFDYTIGLAAQPTYPLGMLANGDKLKFVLDIPDYVSDEANGYTIDYTVMELRFGALLVQIDAFDISLCINGLIYVESHCEFEFDITNSDVHAFSMYYDTYLIQRLHIIVSKISGGV